MAKKWKDLIARMPPERQREIAEGTARLLAEMPLHELRRARELSQEQLAEQLGEKQPSISKLEQRTDMYISTLRRYIEAMGGELDVVARFPTGAIRITQFAQNGNTRGVWRAALKPLFMMIIITCMLSSRTCPGGSARSANDDDGQQDPRE